METWNIKIPDDGSTTHSLRYYNEETESYEKIVKADLYIYDNGEWRMLESTGDMGRYHIYEVQGNNVTIQARINDYYKLRRIVIILAATGTIIVLAALILTAGFLRRRKKKIARAAKNIRKAAIDAVSNIGSQNELFYHGEEDEHGDPVDPSKEESLPEGSNGGNSGKTL